MKPTFFSAREHSNDMRARATSLEFDHRCEHGSCPNEIVACSRVDVPLTKRKVVQPPNGKFWVRGCGPGSSNFEHLFSLVFARAQSCRGSPGHELQRNTASKELVRHPSPKARQPGLVGEPTNKFKPWMIQVCRQHQGTQS